MDGGRVWANDCTVYILLVIGKSWVDIIRVYNSWMEQQQSYCVRLPCTIDHVVCFEQRHEVQYPMSYVGCGSDNYIYHSVSTGVCSHMVHGIGICGGGAQKWFSYFKSQISNHHINYHLVRTNVFMNPDLASKAWPFGTAKYLRQITYIIIFTRN